MTTMTKSRLYSQTQLQHIGNILCERIEELLDHFDLEYRLSSKMIMMKCPIHDGDNPSALNLYYEGDQYRGNWICHTHGCEKVFRNSILGFLRGVLSKQKLDWSQDNDQVISFEETLQFAIDFTQCNISNIQINPVEKNKTNFTNMVKTFNDSVHKHQTKIDPSLLKRNLTIPARYYIDRGYTPEVLNKYDVGVCNTPGKAMYQRVVVPIYDTDHQYVIGCTGRSIFKQCSQCKKYHHHNDQCPDSSNLWKYSKWKHSNGFKADSSLYNYWFAKKHILSSNTIILVESPGNVWRLEEAGFHNSVGLFGSALSEKQKSIIDGSGAMNIILLMDNDKAGNLATQQIVQKCDRTYNIYTPSFDNEDIAEMSVKEIQKMLSHYIGKIL